MSLAHLNPSTPHTNSAFSQGVRHSAIDPPDCDHGPPGGRVRLPQGPGEIDALAVVPWAAERHMTTVTLRDLNRTTLHRHYPLERGAGSTERLI